MPKRFSLAELLILTSAVALWIVWFRIPPVEFAGCIQDRPTKAVQHIDEYRIHGEKDYRRWFERTILASPFATVPGYYGRVNDERSDLLVIPVSQCGAKYQAPATFHARNRLNGSLVFIRHDYVEASMNAQLLVVPSNATVIRGAMAFPIVADVLVVALPIILILVLRRNRHRNVVNRRMCMTTGKTRNSRDRNSRHARNPEVRTTDEHECTLILCSFLFAFIGVHSRLVLPP
jgi:hypothetical protein